MELSGWLVATYNDPDPDPDPDIEEWQPIKVCEACKEIVTYGQRCTEEGCTARLHDICEEAFWRARGGKYCPKCDMAWDGKHFVGERAVTSKSGYQRAKPNRRRTGGGRQSNAAQAAEDVEEEEEEEEEDEEE
jgi:hypothetical protein